MNKSIYTFGVSLKDPTTYAGLSMILSLIGHPLPTDALGLVQQIGQAVGGLLMIAMTAKNDG